MFNEFDSRCKLWISLRPAPLTYGQQHAESIHNQWLLKHNAPKSGILERERNPTFSISHSSHSLSCWTCCHSLRKKQQIAETYRRIDNKQHGKWHANRTMNDVTDMPSIERIWSKNCLIATIHWQRSGWNVMRQEINLIKWSGFFFVSALTVIDIHIISVQGRIYEDNWPAGFPELGKQINLLPYNPSFWERCRDETF